jgi:glycosyltransferase involved in cell wall biosynthesis
MMRILHLDSGKQMRGGQWQVLRLIEGLAAAGVESTLLARPGSPLFEAVHNGGWCVEPIGLCRTILLSRRHDLVHAHDAHGHTLGLFAPCPLLVSRRVAFPIRSRWKYRLPGVWPSLFGRSHGTASVSKPDVTFPRGQRPLANARGSVRVRFIAISEFVKSVLISGGVSPEKIAVVYDGVPLLEAARGTDIVSPAQKSGALARQAAQLAGITLKASSDLQQDLPHAALFVYVTESEGLGSGVLMAMSAGVPVIASRIGGLQEIIQPGSNGMLVENTAESFAAAIRELTLNTALAQRMGEAARHTVQEKFTVDRMVRRTMEVYSQVLN